MGRYPIQNDTWLGWGHTVHFGESGIDGTGFVGFVLVFPLESGEDAGVCRLPDGSNVNFYQIMPLYEDEMNYKIENSTEALLDKFEKAFGSADTGVIDIKRKSAIELTKDKAKKGSKASKG
jgi:hypothetical protein